MQINIMPELPPSGGYESIITAIDVFLRYAFADPVSKPTTVNTAKVIIDIMTRHAYLITLLIVDKVGVFVSQNIHEVVEKSGHIFEAFYHKNCMDPRTGPRNNQELSEKGIGLLQETMAQVFTH